MTQAEQVRLQLEVCSTLFKLCKLNYEESINIVVSLSKYSRNIKAGEINGRAKQSLATAAFGIF
jgi:hypothetical protein